MNGTFRSVLLQLIVSFSFFLFALFALPMRCCFFTRNTSRCYCQWVLLYFRTFHLRLLRFRSNYFRCSHKHTLLGSFMLCCSCTFATFKAELEKYCILCVRFLSTTFFCHFNMAAVCVLCTKRRYCLGCCYNNHSELTLLTLSLNEK